jgi:predicted dinucleotide-binding enzyme
MNITTNGRGNIGGGLARLREQAGHNVTALGRDGGDASDAATRSTQPRSRSPSS